MGTAIEARATHGMLGYGISLRDEHFQTMSWGACATRQGIELDRNDAWGHDTLADGPPRCVNDLQRDNSAVIQSSLAV
jgi:hypothetical protein